LNEYNDGWNLFCPFYFIYFFNWRCFPISNKELQINEAIRDAQLRVIDSDGSQLGIMSSKEAQNIANDKNLDLVKISPNAQPPVCKIMDYGKYRFELAKKDKESRKNQKVITIKEVRMSLSIDTHDLETKAGNCNKFLKAGNKVKVSIRFKGRELAHTELGLPLLDKFLALVEENGTVEKKPKMEGRNMSMYLAPKLQ
jgi:translation initiation factor IF-3